MSARLSIKPSLGARKADFTRQLLLDAAIALVERESPGELTLRAAATEAGISERTVFRYFANRDAFLDAVATEISRRLEVPPHPRTLEELLAAPRALYSRFEAKAQLTRAALHSELFHRIRNLEARRRWLAVQALVNRLAPGRPARDRRLAAANIRHYLSATTWHYFRVYFGFGFEDTVECAQRAVRAALESLAVAGLQPAGRAPRPGEPAGEKPAIERRGRRKGERG